MAHQRAVRKGSLTGVSCRGTPREEACVPRTHIEVGVLSMSSSDPKKNGDLHDSRWASGGTFCSHAPNSLSTAVLHEAHHQSVPELLSPTGVSRRPTFPGPLLSSSSRGRHNHRNRTPTPQARIHNRQAPRSPLPGPRIETNISIPLADGKHDPIFPPSSSPDPVVVVARGACAPPRIELPERSEHVRHEGGRPLRGRLVGHAVGGGDALDGLTSDCVQGLGACTGLEGVCSSGGRRNLKKGGNGEGKAESCATSCVSQQRAVGDTRRRHAFSTRLKAFKAGVRVMCTL